MTPVGFSESGIPDFVVTDFERYSGMTSSDVDFRRGSSDYRRPDGAVHLTAHPWRPSGGKTRMTPGPELGHDGSPTAAATGGSTVPAGLRPPLRR